jgi:hypothetical protein
MRNLRKYLALATAVAMMLTAFPVLGASDYWYADQAEDLNALGLYAGVDPDSFDPALDRELNRQEAAVMVVRLFGVTTNMEDEKLPSVADAKEMVEAKFSDADEIADWAVRHIAYGVENGYINGYPDGTFKPTGALVGRAYCTMIIANLGYEFEYEEAGDVFADAAALFDADEIELFGSNEGITRDTLVGITYRALDAYVDGEDKNIASILVESGAVDIADFDDKEIVVTPRPNVTPSESPIVPSESPMVSEEPTTPGVTETPTVVPTGTVAVEFNPEPATSVADGQALISVGKVVLTSQEDVEVTGLKVKRTGLSADTDIASLTVWDGNKKLNVSAIFSNSIANAGFTSPVKVMAGEEKVLDVRVNIEPNVTAGAQIGLHITEVMTPSTVSVVGNFPMSAGILTVADVTLGTLTVRRASDEPTLNLNAGTTDVRLAKYNFTTAEEAQLLTKVTFTQNGSVADSDLENLKLYDGSTLVAEGVLENRTVTFTFEKEISSGGTARLTLKGDVVGGAGRTVKFGIEDENDVTATGKTYGTTLVASLTNTSDVAVTTIDGKELSVNQGDFILSRSTSTPPAGTISTVVDDQEFARFKIEAVGEPIQLRKVYVEAVAATGAADVYHLSDLKIKTADLSLAQVETPFTDAGADATQIKEVSLSTAITITPSEPVEIMLTADITADKGALANETYKLGVDGGSTTLTGVGMVSGKSVTYSAAGDIAGNVMTVGSLSVTASRVPASNENVFRSESSKTLIEYDIKHNLSETVEISTVVVEFADEGDDNGSTDYVGANFTNGKIVDAEGTVISEVTTSLLAASREGTASFSLLSPMVIQPGETIRVGLVADVLSTANLADDYQFGFVGGANGTVARTQKSGTDVTVSTLAAAGKIVTVSAGGASLIAVRDDGYKLEDANIYAGDKDVALGAYKIYSSTSGKEDAILKKITLSNETSPITVASTRESQTIVFDANATATGTQTFTFENLDISGTTDVELTITDLEAKETIAANLVTAIQASAIANLYTVSSGGTATVTLTSLRDGDIASPTKTGDIGAAIATINDDVVAYVPPTAAALAAGDQLGGQYYTNIRITDEDGNVLGQSGSLVTTEEITLSTPITIPKYSATIPVPDRAVKLVVLADIAENAPYGDKLAIKLGDGTTGTDLEYTASKTGVTSKLVAVDVESGPSGLDAIFTTGAAKLTISDVALADSTPIETSTAGEIGRFTITNNSTRNVSLKTVLVDDLKDIIGANEWDAVKLIKVSTGVTLATGDGAADPGLFTLGTAETITAGSSLQVSVEANLADGGNVGTQGFTGSVGKTDAGTTIALKVLQGTTASGTTYTVLGDSTVMTIDDDLALSTITTQTP